MRALALLPLLAGCAAPYTFTDEGTILHLTRSDKLSVPYVRGAEVDIYVDARGDRSLASYVVLSEDPAVLAVASQELEEDGILDVEVVAETEGETELELVDPSGHTVDRVEVSVRLPDTVTFLSRGRAEVGHEQVVARPQVLVGGSAMLQARYSRDGEALYGGGVLSLRTDEALDWENLSTGLFGVEEWLEVVGLEPGEQVGQVVVDGALVQQLDVLVVDESAAVGARILAESEVDADDGTTLSLYAELFDGAGEAILGGDCTWEQDGLVLPEVGDLLNYEYDEDDRSLVTATCGAYQEQAVIHGRVLYVDDTGDFSCSSTGSPVRGIAALVLGGAALLLRRRGRRDVVTGSRRG